MWVAKSLTYDDWRDYECVTLWLYDSEMECFLSHFICWNRICRLTKIKSLNSVFLVVLFIGCLVYKVTEFSFLVFLFIGFFTLYSSQAGIFSPLHLYGNPRQYFQWGESDRRILNLKKDFAFLSANPNVDSSSGESLGFIGFEFQRIWIQINGLVIYAVPFTVNPKLVRWSSGISTWSIAPQSFLVELPLFALKHIWKHWKIARGTVKYPNANHYICK